MNNIIATKLLQLNAKFYQIFAGQFSDTRQRLQPGVQHILHTIEPESTILDLGCGNGELARKLARQGFRGFYLGLDFSAELLEIARAGVADHPNFAFVQGNLGQANWSSAVSRWLLSVMGEKQGSESGERPEFDLILAFAVLHHLPGDDTRLQTLRKVRALLVPKGRFIHSNWQFFNSERLRRRIHPWSEIGLTEAEVDPGDYLLDWRRGGYGLRYVHHFNEAELEALAAEIGFRVIESFSSDGETGDLGLYQIWEIGE